ncbi:MAG: hypothetical protein EOP48_21975 [Sphingobacteriales bacterium]|nr:MAG: hypothetical protein EOP48_21975 [Sphingobacteriales bacterium]
MKSNYFDLKLKGGQPVAVRYYHKLNYTLHNMKTHEIQLFWNWFYCNEITLRTLRDQKPQLQKVFIYWLDRHLHNYCEGLDCIIMFPEEPNDKLKLIISANGNPEYFDHVITLAEHAPQFKYWKIVPFIQPSTDINKMEVGLDKPYVFKDIILKASDLKFMPLEYEDETKIDMIVYLKDFTVHCNNKNLLQVVFIIMQDLLGEKSLFQNINFVELAQMPEDGQLELIHLYELELYLSHINRDSQNS